VPRVERRDEPLDRAALARCVPSLEQRAYRRPEPALAKQAAHDEAQLDESRLQLGQPLLRLRLGEAEAEIDVVESAHVY
jgi:hypothetical protein